MHFDCWRKSVCVNLIVYTRQIVTHSTITRDAVRDWFVETTIALDIIRLAGRLVLATDRTAASVSLARICEVCRIAGLATRKHATPTAMATLFQCFQYRY